MRIVIQKLIAQSGLCSRREAEKLVNDCRVKVNGKTAKLGERADQDDVITVNNKPLSFTKEHIYIKLHKPAGVVCTTRSFPGEQNVLDLVKVRATLSIVGRLDKESEGLVMLTNDGDLAYKLTHPKFGIDKVYVVSVKSITPDSSTALSEGCNYT
jgi:16S rRNA U516 pseudouridylate synthase RsuA-like enzyme